VVAAPQPATGTTLEAGAEAAGQGAPGSRKSDEFYQRVAASYSARAARTSRPAVEMANDNGVPVTTVHRWVKEARRRGFLPPGQKGRRG
jgi:transposase-like protein